MTAASRHLPSGRTMRAARLGREIACVIVLKILALTLLYYLFFSPPHRPTADTATHLTAPLDPMLNQPISGQPNSGI